MSKDLIRRSITTIACSAALVAAASPAFALTSAAPSLPQSGAGIEKVWCGWGGCGWGGGWGGGWGPAAVVGGVIAGTAIGAAAAASSPYYYGGSPYPYGGYYGPAYGGGPYYAPAYSGWAYDGPAYAEGYSYAPPRRVYGGCVRRWVGYYGRVHWRRVC